MYYCKCKLPIRQNQTIHHMQLSEIIKGRPEDAEKTHRMFVSITDHMLANGIKQWNYTYPDLKTLSQDIEDGHNFIIKDGDTVAASIALDDLQDEQYKKVHWRNRSDSVLVIHRLGVNPKYQGKGLGKKLCLFAEQYAKENNYKFIRLDAYAGNPVSNSMYLKLGYTMANGYCYFHKQPIPFYCFEKKIE